MRFSFPPFPKADSRVKGGLPVGVLLIRSEVRERVNLNSHPHPYVSDHLSPDKEGLRVWGSLFIDRTSVRQGTLRRGFHPVNFGRQNSKAESSQNYVVTLRQSSPGVMIQYVS